MSQPPPFSLLVLHSIPVLQPAIIPYLHLLMCLFLHLFASALVFQQVLHSMMVLNDTIHFLFFVFLFFLHSFGFFAFYCLLVQLFSQYFFSPAVIYSLQFNLTHLVLSPFMNRPCVRLKYIDEQRAGWWNLLLCQTSMEPTSLLLLHNEKRVFLAKQSSLNQSSDQRRFALLQNNISAVLTDRSLTCTACLFVCLFLFYCLLASSDRSS